MIHQPDQQTPGCESQAGTQEHPLQHHRQKESTVNKTQLIDATAEHAGLTKAQTAQAINAAIEVIQAAVAAGEQVTVPGFGTFEASERSARTGRNPQTGEPLDIPAAWSPKFRPGAGFKGLVNASKSLVA